MSIRTTKTSRYVDTPPDDRRGSIYELYMPNGYTKSRLVREKNSGASKVVVWDPSFTEKDWEFYSYIDSERIEVEILTICDKYQSESQILDFFDKIKYLLADKGIEFKLTLRVFYFTEFKDSRSPELWHDRYLITVKDDETDVYLVGTSVSGHLNGHKAFGVCHLKEDDDKHIVINAYDEYCNKLENDNKIGEVLTIAEPEDF